MTSQNQTGGNGPSAAKTEVAEQVAATPEKKTSRLIVVAAAALTAAIAATASFLLFPGMSGLPASAADPHQGSSNSHEGNEAPAPVKADKKLKKTEAKHKTADEKKSGPESTHDGQSSSFVVRGDVAFYILRPMVVTIRPQGRVRYLRVALAIETTPEAEAAFFNHELSILDILNGYLRSLPVSVIEDPSAMTRVREQIARRVRFVVDDVPVNAVLITDFILS